MRTVPDLLEAAANVLDNEGWTTMYLTEPFGGGRHCAIGALLVADGVDPMGRTSPLLRPALSALADKLGDKGDNYDASDWDIVAKWNNYSARDGEEVSQLFRTTAQELRTAAAAEKPALV
jgi:hypothetical protein